VGVFAGDLARRRRAKFVPGDSARTVHQTKEPQHKDDFDEWLARIVCFAFSVPPQWAVKQMNRATADNQSAQSEDEGLEPTKEWVKDLVDEIIADEFASPDLELHWLDEDDGDPETVLADRLKLGAVTLNEMRDHLGLDPYPNPAADRAMVLTATGYVPIEANVARPSMDEAAANVRTQSAVQKYSPDQPRVPAGNSDGGQWTRTGEGASTANSTSRVRAMATSSSFQETRYAALESDTRSDTSTPSAGVQYAADPSRYIIYPSALTGISRIDDATKALLNILLDASDALHAGGPIGLLNVSPQLYGILIHMEFAGAVASAGIAGISPDDIERRFALPADYGGSKRTVIPDVILRSDSGDILAIYDVKTGEPRLDPWRQDEIRAATGVDSTVPIIILQLY